MAASCFLPTGCPSWDLKFNCPLPECFIPSLKNEKVQVGKDQEKAQSEKDFHSKNRGEKKTNQQSGTYTMKTFRKPNEQLFSQ